MKLVAILPARGGSKGLPRKNIRHLDGRPLIAYSVAAAKECTAVAATYISTEDDEVAAVAASLGVPVIRRPKLLAEDHVMTNVVIEHALSFLAGRNEHYTHFVLLQPTSPLRGPAHVTEAIKRFSQSSARSLISVCATEHHPFKDFRIDGDQLTPLFSTEFLERPRQSLEPVYRQNGAIYIAQVDDFLRERHFYVPPCVPLIMTREDSIDIDNQADLDLAEVVLRRRGFPSLKVMPVE